MGYDPTIFNISPYYDDFDPEKRFLRLLFRPGYAIQARELTQIQSLLQDQISKVGDHLFKNGSRVVGAPITVRNTNFLGLKTGSGSPFSAFDSDDWDTLIGGTIYYGATASGTIAHVIAPEYDDKLFVVVDYVSGYGGAIPNTGVTLGLTTASGAGYSPYVASGASHNGVCKMVTVGEGIFYVDGQFVRNEEQNFTPYTVLGNYRDFLMASGGVTLAGLDKKIGFSIEKNVVTSTSDTSLLDPSLGSPNYRAPGADRMVLDLTLDQSDISDADDDFIELLRFQDGKVTKKVDRVVYGDIAKTLERRTFDESGSYIVSPFDVSVKDSSSSENLDVVVGPGKAYVFGQEVETKYPTILGISKARSAETVSNSFVFNTGNVLSGLCFDYKNYGVTLFNNYNSINGGNATIHFRNSSGTVIGRAQVHGLVPQFGASAGFTYSAYLYGVCSGSVIAGASTAVIYGTTSGHTWGIFSPSSGSTFGAVGGTGENDSCLVYELSPTQGVSGVVSLSFYGVVASKTSTSGSNPITVSYNSGTNTTTYTVSPSAIDLPNGVPSSTYLDVAPDLTSSPTSARSTISKYSFITGTIASGAGNTGSAFIPANLNSSDPVTGVAVSKSGSNLVMTVVGAPTGFTGAASIRMLLPYKYTPDMTSNSIRVKTSTNATISSGAYTFTTINGRVGFTLPHRDVYSVSAITVNSANALNDFELDDGGRETLYDHASLIVKKSKEGTALPAGAGSYAAGTAFTLGTSYKYFVHSGTEFGPFVGRHSYSGISYEEIPLFTNPKTGRTVSLANCLDFRHSGISHDSILSKPYGDYQNCSATSASWSNYLPRLDRLSLKINPSDLSCAFDIDAGAAEFAPQSPPETENSLTLATMLLPAYTHSPKDVIVNKNDVRRYTMADISGVEKRIDSVEVFSRLSLAESQIEALQIKGVVDGYLTVGGTTALLGATLTEEPIKTSIYADDFRGHAGGDVVDPDHRVSVDYEYGESRPFFTHNLSSLSSPSLTAGLTISSDGLITLDYSTVSYVNNSGYNRSVAVNQTGTVNWLGFVKLTKQYEPKFDTAIRPIVYGNSVQENDNWVASNAGDARGFGTQWNDWEYLWTGVQIRKEVSDEAQKRLLSAPKSNSQSSIPKVDSGNSRTSVSRSASPINQKTKEIIRSSRLLDRSTHRTVDNRIIDRTVVQYIPTNTIGVTAYGMRPNSSGLYLYVDGTLVRSGLSADSNGTVGTTFATSSGVYLSGEKAIRITDNSEVQNTTQASDGMFYCSGFVRQKYDGVYSTRNPEYRRQTVSSEGIVKDPFNRDVSYDNIEDTVGNNQWTDPLCQTFLVDKKTTPEGIFLKSLTLYFSKKDSSLPITVQLRPTINGYPSPSVSVPFSTVTLMPSQVNTGFVGTSTTPVGTVFTFTSPIYLEPGEYAIAVLTNSKNYEIRVNDSGLNLIYGGRNDNPLVGTLFQPQSVGPIAQDLATDIAFSLDRCEFVSGYASGTATFSGLDVANCQVIKLTVPEIVPQDCTTVYAVGGTTVENNQNKYLGTVFTASQNATVVLTRPSKQYISPVVDSSLALVVGAEMLCTASASTTSGYVTKSVALPHNLRSDGVFVDTEVCSPQGSQVKAYVRWSDNGENELFTKSWVEMVAVDGLGSPRYPFTSSSYLSENEYDFRPTKWVWFNPRGAVTRAYQVKLVYTTDLTGSSKVYEKLPSTRNLKVCSFRTL